MHVLFICSLNRIRSLTAHHLFEKTKNMAVRSAGTQANARVVCAANDIAWADLIFVMEKEHKDRLQAKFPSLIQKKRVICLDIDNGYSYMDPDLVEILTREVSRYVPH